MYWLTNKKIKCNEKVYQHGGGGKLDNLTAVNHNDYLTIINAY